MPDTVSTVALHPWNTDFRWDDRTGPFSTLSAEQVAQFDELGFVVVPDLLDADLVARVRDEIDGFEREMDAFLASRDDGRMSIAETGAITFSIHLVARSPLLRDLSKHPKFVGICRDLVGPDVNLYWDQAVYKKPEKPRRFPWHQDNGYAFVEPQQYLTIWVALTDATRENGCPVVAPRYHRRGTLAHTYVEPLGWECFATPRRRSSPRSRPAARSCSRRSRPTSPARTRPTRSASPTSSSTHRPARSSRAATRAANPPRASRATHPSASTRCSSTVDRSDTPGTPTARSFAGVR